jgi:hypothetical protein
MNPATLERWAVAGLGVAEVGASLVLLAARDLGRGREPDRLLEDLGEPHRAALSRVELGELKRPLQARKQLGAPLQVASIGYPRAADKESRNDVVARPSETVARCGLRPSTRLAQLVLG